MRSNNRNSASSEKILNTLHDNIVAIYLRGACCQALFVRFLGCKEQCTNTVSASNAALCAVLRRTPFKMMNGKIFNLVDRKPNKTHITQKESGRKIVGPVDHWRMEWNSDVIFFYGHSRKLPKLTKYYMQMNTALRQPSTSCSSQLQLATECT